MITKLSSSSSNLTAAFLAVLVTMTTLATQTAVVTAAGEIPTTNIVADVPSDFTGINIGGSWGMCTMFTIVPGTSVDVVTEPANLFTVSTDAAGDLTFTWNSAVDAGPASGVKITVPADQLKSVTVSGAFPTNILSGFTSMERILVSGAAEVNADLSTNVGELSELNVSGGAPAQVANGGAISQLSVSGGSSVTAGAVPSITNVDISGGPTVDIKGDVVGGSISGGPTVNIEGSITGSLNAAGGATIAATSCGSIMTSGGASCSDTSPVVTLDLSFLSTASETADSSACGGGGDWGFFKNDAETDDVEVDMVSGVVGPSASHNAASVVAAITVGAVALTTIGASVVF